MVDTAAGRGGCEPAGDEQGRNTVASLFKSWQKMRNKEILRDDDRKKQNDVRDQGTWGGTDARCLESQGIRGWRQ